MDSCVRKRKRRVCPKCGQELSYSMYIRHQNPVVCPCKPKPTSDRPTSDVLPQDVQLQEPSDVDTVVSRCDVGDMNSSSEGSENGSTCGESELEGIPVLSESDTDEFEGTLSISMESASGEVASAQAPQSPPINTIPPKTTEVTAVVHHICLFISFFQLFYRISERGITLLLSFLKALLSWICTLCPQSLNIQLLRDNLPSNVYFLKQLLGNANKITTYVVCPKCHSIFSFEQCVVTHRNGTKESIACPHIEYPNHPHLSRRLKCNTVLLKRVRCGNTYKLRPRMIYSYNSVKSTLSKLFSQASFIDKCELWRDKTTTGLLTDVYSGKVWQDFHVVNGKPFLKNPCNLCLQLNMDWFAPFKHLQYSIGVIYLVIENLPRSERYKLENLIIVGCIPGPKEPKKHINSFLKPLVDELLDLWEGVILRTSSLFGFVFVRCALTCVTCDLPATRKVCEFTSFSSSRGCSKCDKEFTCASFGEKLDYSGFNRDRWHARSHKEHLKQVSELNRASTASAQHDIERKYGVRNSELLRLPYFDVVKFHVVDPMHNLLLGTAKHMMTIWKEIKILPNNALDEIQNKVDTMEVPTNVGRLPFKISSNFSSFTADQWRNWVCIYSLYCLHGVLPMNHYSCWSLFVEACCYLLLPSLSMDDLIRADEKLLEFCRSFEVLYGKERCTPNMHMHMHIKESILNYGPVYGFWCFPFERYNGVLGSFQSNWISPELQMIRKFITYQDLLQSDLPATMPQELLDFFHLHLNKHSEVCVTDGSVEQTHVESFSLLEYNRNATCPIADIDGRENVKQKIAKRYEVHFNHIQVTWLTEVYKHLYPSATINHVPMVHERFHEVSVLGERFASKSAKGKHSAAVCAYWPRLGGSISTTCDQLYVGIVQYFFKHSVKLTKSGSLNFEKVNHIFANVHWYRLHPRENWFHPRIIVVSTDFDDFGPANFIPLSRCFAQCAVARATVKFDYGEDNVLIISLFSHKFCI